MEVRWSFEKCQESTAGRTTWAKTDVGSLKGFRLLGCNTAAPRLALVTSLAEGCSEVSSCPKLCVPSL